MKVCDRHPTEKAIDTLQLNVEAIDMDLCARCVQMVREFVGAPEKTSVDPEKPKRGFLGLKKN